MRQYALRPRPQLPDTTPLPPTLSPWQGHNTAQVRLAAAAASHDDGELPSTTADDRSIGSGASGVVSAISDVTAGSAAHLRSRLTAYHHRQQQTPLARPRRAPTLSTMTKHVPPHASLLPSPPHAVNGAATASSAASLAGSASPAPSLLSSPAPSKRGGAGAKGRPAHLPSLTPSPHGRSYGHGHSHGHSHGDSMDFDLDADTETLGLGSAASFLASELGTLIEVEVDRGDHTPPWASPSPAHTCPPGPLPHQHTRWRRTGGRRPLRPTGAPLARLEMRPRPCAHSHPGAPTRVSFPAADRCAFGPPGRLTYMPSSRDIDTLPPPPDVPLAHLNTRLPLNSRPPNPLTLVSHRRGRLKALQDRIKAVEAGMEKVSEGREPRATRQRERWGSCRGYVRVRQGCIGVM